MLERQRLLTLSDHAIVAPVQRHPQAEEVERQTKALCEKFGITRPNIDDYNTMTSYMYPRTTVDRLVTISLWMNLLWFIDDSYDRDTINEYSENKIGLRKVLENCVLIMCRGYEMDYSENILYPACRELWLRFSTMASPEWIRRFEFSLFQHLKAATYNVEETMVDEEISVERFIALREIDGGMFPTIDLIEFAFDIYIPEDVLNHEKLQNLLRLNARICTFSNDIFSYEKEVIKLGSRFNLVKVYEESRNLSFDEALHYSILLVNNDTEDFKEAQYDIPDFGDEKINRDVENYVIGLVDQATAAYHWQMVTPRYRSPNSPFEELRQPLS